VPLPVIVRKVLADHAAATLGEFRPLMLAMLTACSHDTALYRSAATLLYEAARAAVRSRKSAAAAGIRVRAITTTNTSSSNSSDTGGSSRPLCAETMAAIAATHGVVKVCANGLAAIEHIGESLSGTTTATAVHLWRLRAARQQQRLTRASAATTASNQHDSNSSSSATDNAVYAVVHNARSSPPRAAAVSNSTGTTAAADAISDASKGTNASSSAGSNSSVSSGSAVQQQQQQSSWGVRGFLGAVPHAISGKLPLRMRGGSISDK
jgi:hypothetical protein